MDKFRSWLESHVWPWIEIARLRRDLQYTQATLQSYLDKEAQHRAKWMSEANKFWGPNPFTDGEEMTMLRFYQQGYGWKEALVLLRSYCGYDLRRGQVQWQ